MSPHFFWLPFFDTITYKYAILETGLYPSFDNDWRGRHLLHARGDFLRQEGVSLSSSGVASAYQPGGHLSLRGRRIFPKLNRLSGFRHTKKRVQNTPSSVLFPRQEAIYQLSPSSFRRLIASSFDFLAASRNQYTAVA